jgi:hypothetical protein
MEKVVWSEFVGVQKAESRSCRLERSWKCQECWRYPRPELNQHRSNSVSSHTLFGDASQNGRPDGFRTKRLRGTLWCMRSGY